MWLQGNTADTAAVVPQAGMSSPTAADAHVPPSLCPPTRPCTCSVGLDAAADGAARLALHEGQGGAHMQRNEVSAQCDMR